MPRLDQIQLRDPFVLPDGDGYCLFGSTDPDVWQGPGVGFDAYRSSAPGALTDFDGPVPAFRPPAGFWSERNFWAPEVHRRADGCFMFATFLPTAGRRGTAVLRADQPLGPYRPWSDGPVTPPDWECLDGTLHVDADGPWLVFCHEWRQVGDGQICALRLTDDLSAAAGPPELLFTASAAPWAQPLPDRPPGSYVTDGPYLWRPEPGPAGNGPAPLFMLWSSFGADAQYCLGAATSDTGAVHGPWRQAPEPLYAGDGGHGMVFAGPGGQPYLALHTPNRTPDERAVFIGLTLGPDGLAATGPVIR
ncbi:MAG: glycoside hydrolase family 43 protein [Propionibacteriaceae bacterium]|jgi:hypothetical protein|nr:glycoside hydrolase family 43 protein [Propionibacteriaceae bacterium]